MCGVIDFCLSAVCLKLQPSVALNQSLVFSLFRFSRTQGHILGLHPHMTRTEESTLNSLFQTDVQILDVKMKTGLQGGPMRTKRLCWAWR